MAQGKDFKVAQVGMLLDKKLKYWYQNFKQIKVEFGHIFNLLINLCKGPPKDLMHVDHIKI